MSKIRRSQLWMKYTSEDILILNSILPSSNEVSITAGPNFNGRYYIKIFQLKNIIGKGPFPELPLKLWKWARDSFNEKVFIKLLFETYLDDLPLEINNEIPISKYFIQWRFQIGK